jgi:CRISPR-associated protein Cmr1
MFGGGVLAGEPDSTMPFRSTSIRGQLQFWWRATKGADFRSAMELSQRHAEIWGSTERASPVSIDVAGVNHEIRKCAEYEFTPGRPPKLRWDTSLQLGVNDLAYVLFPFQGIATREAVQKEPPSCVTRGTFTLRLRYPEYLEEDVTSSLRSWINFGGLGARTRRGCGALYCKDISPKDRAQLNEMLVTLSKYANAPERPWPTAAATVLIGAKKDSALASWRDVVKALRDFRQAPEVGRNAGQGSRPGRSRFPEPETIRRITQTRSQNHPRMAYVPDDAFPRAEFGLPIIFHFKDGGDPPDTQLYPFMPGSKKASDRMASPLILRAVKCINGEIYPIIIRFNTSRLEKLVLKGKSGRELETIDVIGSRKLAEYPNSPLNWPPNGGTGSSLDAFIAFVRAKCEYQEASA